MTDTQPMRGRPVFDGALRSTEPRGGDRPPRGPACAEPPGRVMLRALRERLRYAGRSTTS